MCPGGSLSKGMVSAPGGAWWRPPSPRTGTAAGGMYPTGMHSCFHVISKFLLLHGVSEGKNR